MTVCPNVGRKFAQGTLGLWTIAAIACMPNLVDSHRSGWRSAPVMRCAIGVKQEGGRNEGQNQAHVLHSVSLLKCKTTVVPSILIVRMVLQIKVEFFFILL